MLENTVDGQSRETGNIDWKDEEKQTKRDTTQYVLDITTCKQTQTRINLHKQL